MDKGWIQLIMFVTVLLLSAVFKSDEILEVFFIAVAFMIVIGTIANICEYISNKYTHSRTVYTLWCILVVFTGPIAFLIHEAVYDRG